MRINYAGIELLVCKCRNLQSFLEPDPTGRDMMMSRIEIDVDFQWHPFATASTSTPQLLQNNSGPVGDGIGLSIRNLRRQLNEPRQKIRVELGPDNVWEAPVPIQGEQILIPDGQSGPQRCDPGYGPMPEVVSLAEVTGERFAIGRWRVKFWVLDGSQILLSNRWTTACSVNDAGMTTRTLSGWATCRADAVAAHVVQSVDDFRKWFIVPCPAGFRRTGCRVTVEETGSKCSYVCTDVEDPNPLGITGAGVGATKFEGELTAGIISPIKSVGQEFMAGAEAWLTFGLSLLSIWPRTVSQGWLKITGGKGVSKLALLKLGTAIASDRFFQGGIVAFTVTQGAGASEQNGRWIKINAVFLPTVEEWLFSAVSGAAVALGWDSLPVNIPNLMKLDNEIQPVGFTADNGGPMVLPGDVPSEANETNPAYQNFGLRNSNNSRGSWLGAMVAQSLQVQGNPPDAPQFVKFVKDADRV